MPRTRFANGQSLISWSELIVRSLSCTKSVLVENRGDELFRVLGVEATTKTSKLANNFKSAPNFPMVTGLQITLPLYTYMGCQIHEKRRTEENWEEENSSTSGFIDSSLVCPTCGRSFKTRRGLIIVILGPTVHSLLVYECLSRSSSLAMDEQQHNENFKLKIVSNKTQ